MRAPGQGPQVTGDRSIFDRSGGDPHTSFDGFASEAIDRSGYSQGSGSSPIEDTAVLLRPSIGERSVGSSPTDRKVVRSRVG